MPEFDVQNAFAKRAAVGFKGRGNCVVPGPVTHFQPQWLKDGAKKLEDVTTHAHWVAAYWGKALTQVACQGHVGQQTLSLPEMLTEFLNANKAVIENSTRVAWMADDAKWAEASDRFRRMDREFNVHTHFKTVSESELDKAKKALELAKQKQQGRGRDSRTDTDKYQSRSSSSNAYPHQYAAYAPPTPPQPHFIPTPPPAPQGRGKGQKGQGRDKPRKLGKSTEKGAGKRQRTQK